MTVLGSPGSEGCSTSGASIPDVAVSVDEVSSQLQVTRSVLLSEMRAREDAERQLREERISLDRRVEDRTIKLLQKNRELDSVNQQMKDLARAKNEFYIDLMANVRKSVEAMLAKSDALEASAGSQSPEVASAASAIRQSGISILEMIDRVLDLGRLDVGANGIDIQELEVRSSIVEAVDVVRPFAEQRGVWLRTYIEPGVDSVSADRRFLIEILSNLVRSAVLGARGGVVETRVHGHDSEIEICVDDSGRSRDPVRGSGNAADVAEATWRREADGHEPAGLEISVSRSLAEKMGGRLESRGELGCRCLYSLHLPAAAIPATASRA